MRRHPLFLLILAIFLLQYSAAWAMPRPYVKFILETVPDCHFTPEKGAVVICEDSSFMHFDTLQPRLFSIDQYHRGHIYGYAHVLSARQGLWLHECFLRIILFGSKDSLVSNTFRISNARSEVAVSISDRSVTAHETFRSVHREGIIGLQMVLIFAGIRFIVFLFFYMRPATTLRQYSFMALTSVSCGAMVLLALIGMGYPFLSIFLVVPPFWLFAEAIIFKRFIFLVYPRIYIISSIMISFLAAALVSIIFSAFNI